MAEDKKISELDSLASLAGDDVLPVVDTSLGATCKMALSQLIPTGGDTAEILAKASASDYNLTWRAPYSHKSTVIRATTPRRTNIAILANTITTVPFNTIQGANELDLTVSSGELVFSNTDAETFLLDAQVQLQSSFNNFKYGAIFLYNKSTSTYLGTGLVWCDRYFGTVPAHLRYILDVPAAGATYEVRVLLNQAGLFGMTFPASTVYPAGITEEVIADLVVTKLGSA